MSIYAKNTEVTVEKSKAEIELTLRRYGASEFAYGWNQDKAMIGFRIAGRLIRFMLPLPNRAAREFTHNSYGSLRNQDVAHNLWEKACRQKWRALNLVIKAKLEAVESKITTIDEEFLAHFVLPNGETVGNWAVPQIKQAYENNRMPQLLPGSDG